MTSPNWRSVGTVDAGIGDVIPGLPAGWQQDDIFILAVTSAEGDVIATPSGWTQVASSPQATGASATGSRIGVFWRRATASESAPTITDTGDHTLAVIHAISGCRTSSDPVDVTAGSFNSSSGTQVFPTSVTTTVNDTMLVWVTAHGVSQTTGMYSNWVRSGTTEVTERSDDSTNLGVGGGLGVATAKKASAGSVGAGQADLAVTSLRTFLTIALAPAALAPSAGAVAATVAAYPGDYPTVALATSVANQPIPGVKSNSAVTGAVTAAASTPVGQPQPITAVTGAIQGAAQTPATDLKPNTAAALITSVANDPTVSVSNSGTPTPGAAVIAGTASTPTPSLRIPVTSIG